MDPVIPRPIGAATRLFCLAGSLLLAISFTLIGLWPSPPSDPVALSAWATDHLSSMAVSSETAFFAGVLLMPGMVGLALAHPGGRRYPFLAGTILVCLGLAAYPLLVVLIQGRLTLRLYDIALTPDMIALLVSLLYGLIHNVALFFGFGLILLAVAFASTREAWWWTGATAAVGVLQLFASFPWLAPPWLRVTCALALAVWMALATGQFFQPAPERTSPHTTWA